MQKWTVCHWCVNALPQNNGNKRSHLHNGFIFEWETNLVKLHYWAFALRKIKMPVLSIEDRGRAIGYLESGRTVRTVAELFHVSTAMNHANLYRVLQFLLLHLGTDKWMCSLMRKVSICIHLPDWKTIKYPLIWYIIYLFFIKSYMKNMNLKKCLLTFFAECSWND